MTREITFPERLIVHGEGMPLMPIAIYIKVRTTGARSLLDPIYFIKKVH